VKASLLLLICFTVCAYSINAQVTLDAFNIPHNPDHTDNRRVVESDIPLPVHGADISYDYSGLLSDSILSVQFKAADDSVFTSATRFNYGTASLGPIEMINMYYTEKTSAGIFRVGSYKLRQREGLGAVSGNQADSLNFPGSYAVFEAPVFDLKFPAVYGDVWSTDFVSRTEYELTVMPNLNKVPGLIVQHTIKDNSVVGWGTLRIPTENGSSSIEYEVLLVKEEATIIDSFFLDGRLTPSNLLEAIGLAQGQWEETSRYLFYAPDFERPLLTIELNELGTEATQAHYSVNDLLSSVDRSYTTVDSRAFPNPTDANNTLNIQTTFPMDRAVIQLYDASGRQLYQQRYEGNASQSFELRLPNSLESGYYFYTLVDALSKQVAKGKVFVN
jgi:hypothetical protein